MSLLLIKDASRWIKMHDLTEWNLNYGNNLSISLSLSIYAPPPSTRNKPAPPHHQPAKLCNTLNTLSPPTPLRLRTKRGPDIMNKTFCHHRRTLFSLPQRTLCSLCVLISWVSSSFALLRCTADFFSFPSVRLIKGIKWKHRFLRGSRGSVTLQAAIVILCI